MLFPLLVLAIFLLAAVLMFLRKLPAMLALPLLAVAIAGLEVLSGKLTWGDLAAAVIADGAIRLADPMVISFFGGMLSLLMQKTGIAESFVRRGAELAGDNPWAVAVMMLAIIALLFTTIGGLGAVIMVGTIVLPILLSLGVREYIASGMILFGISLGGLMNANNWAVYRTMLGMTDAEVSSYAVVLFGVTAVFAVLFLTIELIRSGSVRWKTIRGSLGWLAGAIVVLVLLQFLWIDGLSAIAGVVFRWLVVVALIAAVIQSVVRYVRGRKSAEVQKPGLAMYAIPLVPLLMILLYGVPFVPAFMIGLVYGIIVTLRKGTINLTSRAVIEGSASVIPAVALMLGIGMLLSAILGPTKTGPAKSWYDPVPAAVSTGTTVSVVTTPREWPVIADMKPLLESITPKSGLAYVFIFSLLGPLALYRGPLNIWGLGYGVGGILLATGVPPGAVMGILMSLGIIQGVSDPTNTQNVWVANEVRIDVNTIMWRTLPYAWAVAIGGLIVAGGWFF